MSLSPLHPLEWTLLRFRSAPPGQILARAPGIDGDLAGRLARRFLQRSGVLEVLTNLFFCTNSALKSKAEKAHPEEYRRASKKYTYDDY